MTRLICCPRADQSRYGRQFAVQTPAAAFSALRGRPPTDAALGAARSRWGQRLLGYSAPLPAAVETNCAALFELVARSCLATGTLEP